MVFAGGADGAPVRFGNRARGNEGLMSDHEPDAGSDEADEATDRGWQIGDPPEEGREGDEQDSGFDQRGGQGG